ncbi:penicillin acylase family protein [Tropicimonas sp. IMCC6043]|uniref:penicillin acylase family protein n=1 Tax=Tropicimonas sp. IMCC6043 TaxID=2510645 RepID=UPI00101CFED5|nr:penicillin acylase family protein [Tropicimonas sp. IMCC6043]RYH10290.1 penicillin acylase family protein [Tropicimonas sp. IMCC6043]
MERVFRWTLRIVMLVLGLVGVGAVLVYFFASRSLPDYDASWTVDGLTAPVEIVRDTADVPHIFGETDGDVLFGLGLAHAQDRLWQMTMLRRTAQGRLSELFGARTVKTDELLRRLDLYRAADASLAALSAEAREALRAYAAGVNAWIEIVNAEALGRGAPEFFLFSPEIAPWQPADSIAILKLMALDLTPHMQNEILRASASLVLPPERLIDLLPDVPGTASMGTAEYGALFPEGHHVASLPPWPADPLTPISAPRLSGASNAWAAAPARSAAGAALMANDPHLGLSAPSIWYLARLELASGGVIGATIPGVPAVIAGRSERLGWSLTYSYADDQDLFMEELNPADAQSYRTPEGWKDFRTERSIIQVKDAEPVTITLRWSENGPVLPGSHFGLEGVTPPGHVAALAWTGLSETDTSFQAMLELMQAGSIDEAIAAGGRHVAPAVNMVLADRDGVALQLMGALPARDPGHVGLGRIPSLGWQEQNRWQGILPYETNPRLRDPAGGIVGNTNNKTIDRPFPEHVSYLWGDTQRIQRWQKLMAEREVHTRESFIAAQLDTVSFTARSLLPLIARDLWYTGEAAPEGTPERQRQKALEMLANWNGEMNEHLPEPLIYAAWLRQLQRKLIVDDLGPLADAFTHPEPLFIERVFRDIDGASAWCDIRQSTMVETCSDTARIALDEALLWIGETYGSALESLRWGDAHEAHHDHQVLGEMPVLKWFVNIRQSTSGGDNTLQRALTAGTGQEPFANVHAAGYRGVYDFADPDSSVFIIATGQSGHPLSRHYDDLGELWRRGEYIPMTLDPELARAGAVGVTRLEPR